MSNATLKTKLGKVVSDIEALTKKQTEITAKLVTLNAEKVSLTAKVEAAFDPSTITANTLVRFEAGKPKAEREGLVLGVKEGTAKIAVGSGFDAQLYTVKLDAIVAVVKREAAPQQ